MPLPKSKLTPETIRRYVGDESFRRGNIYFRDGMIVHPRRADTTLKAECQGSRGNSYRVLVTLANDQITASECSCPIGGHCKHVAALLLTWLNQPADFRVIETTDHALARRDKDELIALIKQMLARVPDLESLLELPLPTGKKSHRLVKPEVYRRQVAAAFRGSADEWGAETGIARQVDATLDIGSGFLEEGDCANAFAVFDAVAREVLENFGSFHDESGDLSELVARAVDGLGGCLQAENDPTAREPILRALFEVYRFDVNYGGIGLGDAVPGWLLENTNATERKQIAAWVREAMRAPARDEWSRAWHQRVFGGLLLQLEADTLDDEAYIRICRESHRLDDLVARLLARGRVDEARRDAQAANDFELLGLADLFTRAQHAEIAAQLVAARAEQSNDTRLAEWLARHYESQRDPTPALIWARKLLDARPALAHYRQIRKLADPLGQWNVLREELLADLRRKNQFGVLTEIHLAENEISAAIETVAHIQHGFGVVYPNLRITVAQAAEATHPRDALRLYASAAEKIIERRDRGFYARACEYLVCVRRLYQQIGEAETWSRYVQKIKEDTKAMRAFKAEMGKAGLE
ncbi:MAG: SWIM zinc finger family protein [Chloroflexi bacterium]|nr:SWIM zinc finger family protein [Chloroflexota bacterium]